jgi:hypothetical protein
LRYRPILVATNSAGRGARSSYAAPSLIS